MSEQLAKRLLAIRPRPARLDGDVVRFAGGVNTEDQYGGRLGQGALRDSFNIDISESGYMTKGGWVRYSKRYLNLPVEGVRVIYVKANFYPFAFYDQVYPSTGWITNFNSTGKDIYVLAVKEKAATVGGVHYSAYLVEIIFAVHPDDNWEVSDFAGATFGTCKKISDGSTVALLYASTAGPHSINELGYDAEDLAYEALGYYTAQIDPSIQQYKTDAYTTFRASITQAFTPPSESGVGIFVYKDEVYILVDNGVRIVIRRCGPSNDWTEVDLGSYLYFKDGSVSVDEGATITGGTSGATATAYRVVLVDGTFEGGDARGYFTIGTSMTGSFSVGEDIKVGATVVATAPASGTILEQVTITRGTGYKFRHSKYNFSGFEERDSVYFVTGTSYAFEFFRTGSTFVVSPITSLIGIDDVSDWNTIDSEDKPKFISAHRGKAFLGYAGGSIQESSSGNPLDLRAVVGFDEKSTGEDITNFVPEVGGTMLVSTTNQWWALYGDTEQNYDLQLITPTTGALADTASGLAGTVFIDSQGITTIKQASDYGNWSVNALTRDVETRIRHLINNCTPIATIAIRDKSIIRFLFSQTRSENAGQDDAETVWIAMKVGAQGIEGYTFGAYNKKIIDITESEMVMFPGRPQTREVFFLASDGYVYRDEVSCVADDVPLRSSFSSAELFARSPHTFKHWQEAYLYASCLSGSECEVSVTYHDADGFRRAGETRTVTLASEMIYWDTITWDEAYWDDGGHSVARIKTMGLGDAISFEVTSDKFLENRDFYKSIRLTFVQTEVRRHR